MAALFCGYCHFSKLNKILSGFLLKNFVGNKKLCHRSQSISVSHIRAGANASAVMYSMIETAKANNLNMFQYLYTLDTKGKPDNTVCYSSPTIKLQFVIDGQLPKLFNVEGD